MVEALGKVKFPSLSLPDLPGFSLPGFQHGGFIPPGVVTPAILHGGSKGEVVIPLGQGGQTAQAMGGGGLTINIYAETLIGGEEAGEQIAELVAPHIREMMSG